jgi:hypothetical protein
MIPDPLSNLSENAAGIGFLESPIRTFLEEIMEGAWDDCRRL